MRDPFDKTVLFLITAETIGCFFRQELVLLMVFPSGEGCQFSSIRIYIYDSIEPDMSVVAFSLRCDGRGVIPEIKSVHIAEVEPESHVMWMIDSFMGTGIDGITPGNCFPRGCKDGKEEWFFQRIGIDKRGEITIAYSD